MTIKNNPWNVWSIKAFTFLVCPDCDFKTQKFPVFKNHAVAFHPLAEVLFNQVPCKISDVEDFKQVFASEELERFFPENEHCYAGDLTDNTHEIIKEPITNDFFEDIKPNLDQTEFEVITEDLPSIQEEPEIDEKTEVFLDTLLKEHLDILESEVSGSSKKYCCPQCPSNFIDEEQFQRHILAEHPDSINFFIDDPDNKNKTREQSIWNVATLDSYLKYACETCELRSDSNEKHDCKETKPLFKKKPVNNSKPKKPQRTSWSCHFCKEKFFGQKALLKHRKEVHKTFQCPDCPKVFDKHASAMNHWSSSHRFIKCEECNKTFKAHNYHKHRLSVHADKNDKKYKCETCPFSSHAQRYISEHRSTCPGTERGQQNLLNKSGFWKKTGPFRCSICDDEYTQARGYVAHYRKVHDSFPPELDQVEKVFCDLCPKQFLGKRALYRHKTTFHPEKCAENYTCDKCNITFQKSLYLHHYRQVHNDIPPEFQGTDLFLCHLCPQAYISRKGLDIHVRVSHKRLEENKTKKLPLDQEKKHRVKKCPECAKTFRAESSSALREHIMVVHRKKTPFHCTHCAKEFGTCVAFKKHMKNHTKCYCDICLIEISSAYKLERHKGEDHGIYPENAIRCMQCPRYFYLKTNYEKHVMKKHPNEFTT